MQTNEQHSNLCCETPKRRQNESDYVRIMQHVHAHISETYLFVFESQAVPKTKSPLSQRNLKTQLSFYRQASVAYTLIRYENGAFQKRSSNLNVNILKTKLFSKRWRHDGHVISCQSFSQTRIQTGQLLFFILNICCDYQSENAVF